MPGLIGKKIGMTSIFSKEGKNIPCTILEVGPCKVTQIKTEEIDGYNAIQLGFSEQKESRVSKAALGHFKKAKSSPLKKVVEFIADFDEVALGDNLNVELFEEGDFVTVAGTSKGKGYAGVIKRHNFAMQDATHGNSLSHRAHGSIGQCQTPGRVWKGKKMSGHMGDQQKTVQNLEIASIDSNNNLLLIKGPIPGPTGSNVILKPAVK